MAEHIEQLQDVDDAIRARFAGVENSPPPTEEQKDQVAAIRTATLILAHTIQKHTADGRYRATALTHLETAAMFAVKGVFQK
jgi:hypothetical protein